MESPHVHQMVATLEERIRTGQYAAGRWFPPERELCVEFDVSRATLRLALIELERRQLLVRATGCRPLVKAAVGTQYVRRRESKRGNIGLCLKQDPRYSGTYLVTRGVQQSADNDAFRLIIGGAEADTIRAVAEAEAQTLTRMIRDQDIEGIVLWYSGATENLPILNDVRAAGIPIVFVDRRPPEGFEADYVGIDNVWAARQVVQHLLAQGHRSIAHVTNSEPVSAVQERIDGWSHALRDAGISVRDEWLLRGRVEGMNEEGLSAGEIVDHLLGQSHPPTAVFAVTDYSALGIVHALEERGKRVPQDMAVAGFDDIEQWLPQKPFLTTVRQPFQRIGFEAARLLINQVTPGWSNRYRDVLIDASLVVRESA